MTHPDRTPESKTTFSWRKARFALYVVVAGLSFQQAAFSQQAPETNPDILKRAAAMQAIDKESKAINAALTGPAADLAAHGKALAQAAKDAAKAFEPNVPGGGSRPEIWSNAAEFSMLMSALVANSEAVAKAAEAGNLDGVRAALPNLGCRTCHMSFRIRRAPPPAA